MTPIPNSSSNSGQPTTNEATTTIQDYDVIVVGAGFSGISALYRMRKAGLKAHIFEGGSDFGGVWYWNRYPGARVDSETPWYQLNIPEVYKTWNFSQRFPDHVELRKYMAHVDKTLNLREDTSFNAKVNSSKWDAKSARWTITTENGITARAQFLILGTGLLHKAHLPEWPGRENYKGGVHHSGEWLDNIDVKGKKVAIIGAGATSVQIVQEVAKEASQLSVLLRRPSYCLPSKQRTWTEEEQRTWKAYYPAFFDSGRKSATGFPLAAKNIPLQDESPEEREKYFETIWEAGGFHFLLRNYNNVSVDKEANKAVYDFWKNKVRERLTDPEKQKIMAPDEMPYYFSTKRTPLEHDYYDMLNRDNVDLVDINEHPIEGFTENGLQLCHEEGEREYDVVICATGFDSFTGSIVKMGLESKNGVDIKDVWKDGVKTYLGIMVHGFPNTFMVYSPQAPTALSNGPTIIECQSDIAAEIITSMRLRNAKSIEPTEEAAEKWKFDLNDMVKNTLFPDTNSWWNTSNIPGKKPENQNYILGLQTYENTCRDKMDGWKGFRIDAPQQAADEWKGIDVGGPQQVAVS